MITDFPRVTLPGVEVTPEGAATVRKAMDDYREWRGLKAVAALALIRTGQTPHVKPPAAVIAKRRAANKAARIARRAGR